MNTLAGIYGDVSEELYPVLAINTNQPEGSVHTFFFTRIITRACCYTHVMSTIL